MLLDIFSSFDPGISFAFTSISPSFFWSLQLLILLLLQTPIAMNPSRHFSFVSAPSAFMHQQINTTTGTNLLGMSPMISTLMLWLVMFNLCGLIPYMFSGSSQLAFTFTIGLPLWLGLVLSGFQFNPKITLAHFTPSSAPNALAPALVIIETLSMLVRPITLSFRLAANMSAGHIVMTLIGSYLSFYMFNSAVSSAMLSALLAVYTIFEVGICMIQAYIFTLLLSLFSNEHPSV